VLAFLAWAGLVFTAISAPLLLLDWALVVSWWPWLLTLAGLLALTRFDCGMQNADCRLKKPVFNPQSEIHNLQCESPPASGIPAELGDRRARPGVGGF